MRRSPLHEFAQEEIKAHILDNALKAGDQLPSEGELARQMSISRNSVREAVKALEGLGILEMRRGLGIFVRDFGFESIIRNLPYGLLFELKPLNDVLEVRFHLEYGIVERVVQAATDEQVERLREIVERMREDAEGGAYSAEADRSFHRVLCESVGNSLLERILELFWDVCQQALAAQALSSPIDPPDTCERHAAIVEAVEARSVEALQEATKRHFVGIKKRLAEAERRHSSPASRSRSTAA